jgi:hypothetical protein
LPVQIQNQTLHSVVGALGFADNVRGDLALALRKVSVIILCSDMQADIRRADTCGANARLLKPVRPEQLDACLENLALVLDEQGKRADEESVLRDLVSLRRKLLETLSPPQPKTIQKLINALVALTATLLAQDKFADAESPRDREVQAVRDFNEYMAGVTELQSVIVPIGLSTVVRRRLLCWFMVGSFPTDGARRRSATAASGRRPR